MTGNSRNFVLTDTIPDASLVFKLNHKSLSKIRNSALVALDTNVLIAPYKLGTASFSAIISIYKALSESGRLVLPGHVAREFARRRPYELSALIKALRDQSSRACAPATNQVPFLEEDHDYKKARALGVEIDEKIAEARKLLNKTIDRLSDPVAGDPILNRYSEVFRDCVYDIEYDEQGRKEFNAECEYRFLQEIPPGYKDESKPENAGGDLLIWKSVIAAAKEKNKDTIFVTGEEKADWWVRSDRASFQPRYELIDEFSRRTGGKTIHILPLHRLVELFEGAPEAIAETENLERSSQLAPLILDDAQKLAIRRELMSLRVAQKSMEDMMANLPLDENKSLSLPWNRDAQTLARRIGEVTRRRRELRRILNGGLSFTGGENGNSSEHEALNL